MLHGGKRADYYHDDILDLTLSMDSATHGHGKFGAAGEVTLHGVKSADCHHDNSLQEWD